VNDHWPHSYIQATFVGYEHRILFKHMVHGLAVVQPEVEIWFGLTWFTKTGFFISIASSLLIRLAILTSAVMDDLMEWRLPFEEIVLVFDVWIRITSIPIINK